MSEQANRESGISLEEGWVTFVPSAAAGSPREAYLTRWRGELSVTTLPRAESLLADTWSRASGTSRLLLDLSDLEFIDSSGIGFLLGARKEALRRGHDPVIVVPDARDNQCFRMMRSSGVFAVARDLLEALARPAPPPAA